MYQTDVDLSPLTVIHLMRQTIKGIGLKEARDATDYIRANPVAREFVATLLESRKRVSDQLRIMATEIWPFGLDS